MNQILKTEESYHLSRDEELLTLAKSAAARKQWLEWFYDNDPIVASVIDIGKSYQLSDSETLKLVICALARRKKMNYESFVA